MGRVIFSLLSFNEEFFYFNVAMGGTLADIDPNSEDIMEVDYISLSKNEKVNLHFYIN